MKSAPPDELTAFNKNFKNVTVNNTKWVLQNNTQ